MDKKLLLALLATTFATSSFAAYMSAEELAKHEERRAETRAKIENYRQEVIDYRNSEEFAIEQERKKDMIDSYQDSIKENSESIRAKNKAKVESNLIKHKNDMLLNANEINARREKLNKDAEDLLLENDIEEMLD